MKPCSFIALILVCGFGGFGCEAPKPPATPDKVEDEVPVTPKSKPVAKDDDAQPVRATADEKIVKMCELPDAQFDFDSSSVSADGRKVVGLIATCFLQGPGKGKHLNVLGHADPRGEEEYNLALGQRRAGSVGGLFKAAGLGEDRVSTSSRGELDATGTDAAGWSHDRRVEIQLAP